MVTLRSGGGRYTGPNKTPLQARRDDIARRLRKTWLPNPLPPNTVARPNLQSRGITNDGGWRCYQNSVLQAFMHTPIFLHWIKTHPPCLPLVRQTCTKCSMRALVDAYWGQADPIDNPIPQTTAGIPATMLSASRNLIYNFAIGAHGDANEYYDWLVDEMQNTGDVAWQEQYETLYRIDLETRNTCRTCRVVAPGPATSSNQITIDGGLTEACPTLMSALIQSMRSDLSGVTCTNCNAPRDKIQRLTVVAAPQVLRINLSVMMPFGKIFNPMEIPEEIDLTRFQENKRLRLSYKLASVISHGGSGEVADFTSDHFVDPYAASVCGHYIASARGRGRGQRPPKQFRCISDEATEIFTQQQFLDNPQNPVQITAAERGFQVVQLTYLKNETRLDKELRALGNP